MRHIDRLPIPAILTEKQEEWQEKYESKLESDPKARPDSSKYAHKQIKDTLYAMSNGKCFYYMSPDQPYSLMCEVYIKRYLGRLIA